MLYTSGVMAENLGNANWLAPGEMMGGAIGWEWEETPDEIMEHDPGDSGAPLVFAEFRESPHCGMLHSGRAAWECLLRTEMARRTRLGLSPLRRVLVPQYTCATVWEPIARLELQGETYRVSLDLEPLLPRDSGADDVLLLTDYFGVTRKMVLRVGRSFPGTVIVDATMAFYSRYHPEWGVFYSVRKWAGVPDGGVALSPHPLVLPDNRACSEGRLHPLLLRRNRGAQAARKALEETEAQLSVPALRMSHLTRKLVKHVDWGRIARRRRENFMKLHSRLAPINRLRMPDLQEDVPFCYPLVSGIPGLRDELIDAGVALPLLWPEVIEALPAVSEENELARSLLPLPIDHRYGAEEMDWLCQLILA